MGIKCGAISFQKFMGEIFRGQNNVFVYIDHVLIFSNSYEEHLNHCNLSHFSAHWKRLRLVTGLMAFEIKRTLDAGLFVFIDV